MTPVLLWDLERRFSADLLHMFGNHGTIRLNRTEETKEFMKVGETMKTDKLWVNGNIRRNSEVNEILQAFADQAGITGRDFRHMNLLTEETLGMAHQLLKDFDGEIWIETTPAGYDIILEADVHGADEDSASTPDAPPGFMAKIAEMLNCAYMFESICEMPESLAVTLPDYLSYGIRETGDAPVWTGKWSLSAYRYNLLNHPGSKVNLDELEKSIVGSLADEVTIGIQGHRIRLVISKRRNDPD